MVETDEVLKGGVKFAFTPKDGKEWIVLEQGNKTYDVSDKIGKILATYQGITVVEITKEKKGK